MTLAPPPIAALRTTHAELEFAKRLQRKIDFKTKPQGALGQLEGLAWQLGCIHNRECIEFQAPQMVVFAADHGITAQGVSAFPAAVTQQMVANMLAGGAAVNVFARQHGFALTVVDAGVSADLSAQPRLQHRKVAMGTADCSLTQAMTAAQAEAAVQAGMDVVRGLPGNVLALGEMGIGNTSSAALMFCLMAGISVDDAAGRGTGLNDAQMLTKRAALGRAANLHAQAREPLQVLAAVGGFEIAMMTGAMLQAASERRVVLVDGFIAGAAALAACTLAPTAKDYLVFCHEGSEHGHRALLAHLGAKPLLQLGLRLGEGTGALLAWPLVQSAALFLNEMASFESAGVQQSL